MVRPFSQKGCSSVELEVWEMPIENFGRFIAQVIHTISPTHAFVHEHIHSLQLD